MRFVVTLEDGEGGYIVASCPALPGCHTQGTTKDEAMEGYLVSMREQGEPIPVQVVDEVEVSI